MKKISHKLFFLLKSAITILLCGFIINNVEWELFKQVLNDSNILFVSSVFLLMLFNISISALKWKMLLKPYNVQLGLTELTSYYFITVFFNNFFPGNIGGDGYRMLKLYKNNVSKTAALIPIFMERFTGVLMLLFLGFVGATITYITVGDEISYFSVVVGSLGIMFGFVLTGYFIFQNRSNNSRLELKQEKNKFKAIFVKALNHIAAYRHYPKTLVLAIVISLLFYLCMFFARFILIDMTGESVSFSSLVLVIWISTIFAMLPISINGYGTLDISFIYLISLYGVGYESAVVVMLIHRLLMLSVSLIGGVFYFAENYRSAAIKLG